MVKKIFWILRNKIRPSVLTPAQLAGFTFPRELVSRTWQDGETANHAKSRSGVRAGVKPGPAKRPQSARI
jgi:hypothetical protein